jgi:uncharacterized protein (DUF58 family)
MITPDVLQRIRQIEIQTRRLVNSSFAGAYHAVFKGRGITFESVRPYQPGDDIRSIDWNVTARTNQPYVKQYMEERELTVMICVDLSASCRFGTVQRQKRALAAEIGAVLALSATQNNDNVGLLTFTDQIEQYIRPRKGRNHILRIIRELLADTPTAQGTDLAMALETLNQVLRQGAIIFLLSDFLASNTEFERNLHIVARRHDTIAITLQDPLEQAWPDVGLVRLVDSETGQSRWIDTHAPGWHDRFKAQSDRFRQYQRDLFRRTGVDQIDLRVDEDVVSALSRFFRSHRRRDAR